MTSSAREKKLYGGDPAELPVYPLSEVAHFLWMPHRKLYRWSAGYTLDGKRQPAIIQIADRKQLLLSFNNLAELHILSALRNEDVSLQRVRQAIAYLRKEFDEERHPLLSTDLSTDGANVFIEKFGQLVNISRHGQVAFREILEAHLRRIDRDPNSGTVLRLFPFVKAVRSAQDAVGQARLVAIDPRVSFGRPVIAGTRVPTTELAGRWSAGETIAEIAEDFGLDAGLVEDAIRYERADRRVA